MRRRGAGMSLRGNSAETRRAGGALESDVGVETLSLDLDTALTETSSSEG